MAAVGIDLGNFASCVGVARAGGVEVVVNEYSDRLTPTYVSFDQSKRTAGQAAKAMEVTHAKNTISNFKRLLGRRYQDNFVSQEKEFNVYSIDEGTGGTVNIEVDYLNGRRRFTPEQVTGIMLTKLKSIANNDLGSKAFDCVVAVPCFFTDAERRAMLDAAYIAGWNCLRLLNETTAVALCYGIYKADLPEVTEKPRLVAFVDLGYTALQASIVAFNRGKLKMLATGFDPSLGGRDFDRVIMNYMRDEFKQNYRIDAFSNIKAKLRLRSECEKAKKLMSSNTQPIPISLECFIDEKDVSGRISREKLEELSKPLLDRIRLTLINLFREANLTADDIESVEIVGGSTRIPAVKQIVQDVFHQTPMTTMNADESVARGCTLMCAMLSPTFRVKEFKIEDCQPYPITVSWRGGVNEDNEVEVFSRWNPIPSTKMLCFYKREPLTIQARYSYPNDIPFFESRIGKEVEQRQYTIEKIQPQPDGSPSQVKLKVRLNRNGIFGVTHAILVENDEASGGKEAMDPKHHSRIESIETNEDTAQSTNPEGPSDSKDDEASGNETKRSSTKKKTKEIELPITVHLSGVSKAELDRCVQQENDMIVRDEKENERSDAKNALEEYIYDMRSKLDGGEYEKFVDERQRQKFLVDLRSAENWLYDQGMDQGAKTYLERLKALKTIGDPIHQRHHEAEYRSYQIQEFRKALQKIDEAIQLWQTKSNDRYAHLDRNEIDKVRKILLEKKKWFDQIVNRLNSVRQHDDPPILCAHIQREQDMLNNECWSILNKPKAQDAKPSPKKPGTSKSKSAQNPSDPSNKMETH